MIVDELDVSRRDAELLQSTIDNMQDNIDNLNAMILDLEKQLETGGAQVLHSITKKI
jgi:asparagine synthetase A